jgi:hypothetical protein
VSQPKGSRCLAMNAAFARTSSSVTDVPKQSQLFQPIGGVPARVIVQIYNDRKRCASAPRHALAQPVRQRKRALTARLLALTVEEANLHLQPESRLDEELGREP